MPFSGSLVDCYGMSDIDGEISPHEFIFDKKYRHGAQIKYEFKKNDKGIWVGEYSAGGGIGKGYATAQTNLDWRGVEFIYPEPVNPEEWAKNLLEQMVDNGMLEIVKDNKTGEEVVLPK